MKKIFTKRLFIYMAAALIITVTVIFGLQTFISKSNNMQSSRDKLEDVKAKLESNQQNIEDLTKSLGENNLQKQGHLLICLLRTVQFMAIKKNLRKLKTG